MWGSPQIRLVDAWLGTVASKWRGSWPSLRSVLEQPLRRAQDEHEQKEVIRFGIVEELLLLNSLSAVYEWPCRDGVFTKGLAEPTGAMVMKPLLGAPVAAVKT